MRCYCLRSLPRFGGDAFAVVARARARLVPVASALLVAAIVLVTSAPVLASPPDTTWTEDVHLHPSGPAELQFLYERHPGRDDADLDVDAIALRAAAGFDRAPLDFTPTIGLVQTDLGSALEHFGLRIRYRFAGTPGEPTAIAFGGYRRLLAGGRAHLAEQGAAARWTRRSLAVAGELSVREALGGEGDAQVEVRAGGAVTYGLPLDLVRIGVEAFALVPLTGDRIGDFAQGGDSDALAVYAGPTLRLNAEYLWISVGVATGALTSAGSPASVRALIAAQF